MISNILENFSSYFSTFLGGAVGGFLGGALIVVLAILFILVLALYVYTSLALMTIAKNLKHKYAWVAWIPIAHIGLILQLGNFHWAWVFLILLPVFGWAALFVLVIIAFWRIFVKLGRPGWWSLTILIDLVAQGIGTMVFLVLMGIAAWGKGKKK